MNCVFTVFGLVCRIPGFKSFVWLSNSAYSLNSFFVPSVISYLLNRKMGICNKNFTGALRTSVSLLFWRKECKSCRWWLVGAASSEKDGVCIPVQAQAGCLISTVSDSGWLFPSLFRQCWVGKGHCLVWWLLLANDSAGIEQLLKPFVSHCHSLP